MEKKTLHIVSSLSIKAVVRVGLDELDIYPEISFLPINFSFGYIPKDFSDKELCFALASHNQMEAFDQLKDFVTTVYSQYEKVIVWHGWSAQELLMLYLMSVLTYDNLYHIDITSCAEFMKKQNSWPYVDMWCVCPGDIKDFSMLSLAKKVMGTEKTEYIGQWNRWKASTKPYRFSSAETGIIEEYPADFMDDTIIKYAKEGRVLGALMAKVFQEYYNLFISDSIILKRIRELYREHKLNLTVSIREK